MPQISPQFQQLENFFNGFMSRIIGANHLVVIMPASIGDFIFNGILAHALKKKYNKDIILLVQERFKDFKIKFDGVREIFYIPLEMMLSLQRYIIATGKYSGEGYIYGHFPLNMNRKFEPYFMDRELYFLDRYKKNYGLPLDTPIHNPIIADIDESRKAELHQKYNLDKERTVILFPVCSSYLEMNSDKFSNFWRKLTREFNERGYTVYENIGKNHQNQKDSFQFGNEPLEVNINELCYIADKVKCCIGMRSGIFDVLSFTKANLFAVMGTFGWYYDLKTVFPESNSRTFYTAAPMLNELKLISEKYAATSINVSNLAFKNIDNSNVYITEEDLMAAILTELEKL